MSYRVAINGFGRIGRNYLRAALERGLLGRSLHVVAINDLWDPATLAHLLEYDSTFGRLRWNVTHDGESLDVDGHRVHALREFDPGELPWADLGVDLVIEATGKLRTREEAARHVKVGSRRVLITAPGKDLDATFVFGVNHHTYDPAQHQIVSAASCTTNCLAPMVKVLNDAFGVVRGYLTTVHAYTNDQVLLDSPHKDRRRGRSAAVNIIPTSTGAARAIGLVLPELAGRLDGVALRVPVEDGSMCDLTCQLAEPATAQEVNAAFQAAAATYPDGVLRYTDAPLVSRDIVDDAASCVFDAGLTRSDGTLATVFGWYDNECAYANRLVDLTLMMADQD